MHPSPPPCAPRAPPISSLNEGMAGIMRCKNTKINVQSPVVNNHSPNQKSVCLLLNPKIYYRVHKNKHVDSILSQLNRSTPWHCSHWRSILLLYSNVRVDNRSCPFSLSPSTKILYVFLVFPKPNICPVHLILIAIDRSYDAANIATMTILHVRKWTCDLS
jgi:hypothetical protein